LTLVISQKLEAKLQRVKERLGQASIEDALEAMTETYLDKKDPIRKAERNLHVLRQVPDPKKSLPQYLRNRALRRDKGECQKRLLNGTLCSHRNWVEVHHIIPLSEGGTHDLSNLTTLCRAHHQMTHDHEGRRLWKELW